MSGHHRYCLCERLYRAGPGWCKTISTRPSCVLYVASRRSVNTISVMYAATLMDVSKTTTLPLVRNLLDGLAMIQPGTRYFVPFIPFPAETVISQFAEKLPVALHAAESAHCEHACSVRREERSCSVRKSQHHQCQYPRLHQTHVPML